MQNINKSLLLGVLILILGLALGFLATKAFTPPQVNISIDTEESKRKVADAQKEAEYYKNQLASFRDEVGNLKRAAEEAADAYDNLQKRNRELEEELQNKKTKAEDNDSSEEDDELAPGYRMCLDNAEGHTIKLAECNEKAANYIDDKLLIVYKKVLKSCDQASRPNQCRADVKKMELAWIRYVDMMSGYIYQGAVHGKVGGTLNRIIAGTWRARAKKTQLGLLESLLEEE